QLQARFQGIASSREVTGLGERLAEVVGNGRIVGAHLERTFQMASGVRVVSSLQFNLSELPNSDRRLWVHLENSFQRLASFSGLVVFGCDHRTMQQVLFLNLVL